MVGGFELTMMNGFGWVAGSVFAFGAKLVPLAAPRRCYKAGLMMR